MTKVERDFELDRYRVGNRYLAATNMIHHACYRWNEESKISPKMKQNARKMETQLIVLFFL